MKKLLWGKVARAFILAIVIFSSIFLPISVEQVSADSLCNPYSLQVCSYWHSQSQAWRNSQIYNQAYSYYANQNANGKNCKQFANDVMYNASYGAINLPQTATDSTWVTSSNFTNLGQLPFYRSTPGQFVQMQVRLADGTIGPHTAIIAGYDLYGFVVIDSNYVAPYKVGYHSLANQRTHISPIISYTVYQSN